MIRLLFLALSAASLVGAQVTVEPPALIQCESATITWSGGTGPYNVYIYPEFYLDEISFLEQLGPVDGTSVEWLVNLPEGDRVRINVRDATNPGFEGSTFADPAQIASGSSDSCLASGPLGTGGLPDVPSGTSLPTFSPAPLPSISTFDPSATGRPTSGSASGSGSTITSSSPRASSTGLVGGDGPSSSASLTGPVNGDGPAASDSPNGAQIDSRVSLAIALLPIVGAFVAMF